VSEDVDESPYVYGYLCDLIEANHPTVLGPNNSNLARIVGIFAEAFSVDALPPSHEVHSRMVNIIRQVQVGGKNTCRSQDGSSVRVCWIFLRTTYQNRTRAGICYAVELSLKIVKKLKLYCLTKGGLGANFSLGSKLCFKN
jgi:hypothetical protein